MELHATYVALDLPDSGFSRFKDYILTKNGRRKVVTLFLRNPHF